MSFFTWLKSNAMQNYLYLLEKLSIRAPERKMLHTPALTLMDLNYDCVIEILSRLKPADRMRMAIASRYFDNAVAHFIKSERFNFSDYEGEFGTDEIIQIMIRFGPHIRDMYVRFNTDKDHFLYDISFPGTCVNLEEVTLSWLGCRNQFVCFRILAHAVNLKVLNLENYDINDGFCPIIGNLTNVEKLRLGGNNNITGRGMENLAKLVHLDLKKCERMKSKVLIGIFQRSKLKFLNIADCLEVEYETLKWLVKTQDQLERIEVNSYYPKVDSVMVARLPNLKEIRIHSCCLSGKTDVSLLAELVKLRSEQLTSLELFNYWVPPESPHRREMRELTLQFPNLKRLRLEVTYGSYSQSVDDGYLQRLVYNCPKLEDLKVGGWRNTTPEKVLWLVRELKELKILDLSFGRCYKDEFYMKLVEVVKKKEKIPLMIFVLGTDFRRNIVESKEYKENRHLVEISFDSTYVYL